MASMSSMLMSEGNLRSAAGGFIGAKSGIISAAAGMTAEAPLFGLRNAPYQPPGNPAPPTQNRPMAISLIRFKFLPVTTIAVAQVVQLELHKTDSTANFTNGLVSLAQRKKFSGYAAIPATEIDVKIADTAPLSGGSQVQQQTDQPFDMAGAFGTSPTFESLWWPEDGIPLVLEQNEGLILHLVDAIPAGAGQTFRIFVGIDFYRF